MADGSGIVGSRNDRFEMFDLSLIQTLGIVVVSATLAVLVARLVMIPNIVAYLLAGLLLGPVFSVLPPGNGENGEAAAPQIIGPSDDEHDEPGDAAREGIKGGDDKQADALQMIAKLGIVLLLFLVGLELNLAKIRDVGGVAVAAGLGQVVFTALVGFIITYAIGFSIIESAVIATALTFSSTVVVVKTLDQKGDLNSLYGRIAVGIFLVQDLVVIAVLTVLAGLETADEWDVAIVGWGILKAFLGMALIGGLALLAALWLLPKPFRWVARSPRVLMIWSLTWCLLVVVLADRLGLSIEIGAFLAGLALAQLDCTDDLRRRVHPLMSFFIAVFFVTLGAELEFGTAAAYWWQAVVLSLFVLIGNFVIFMFIIARFRYSERTAFCASVTVTQISEFSFIFAAAAISAGLLDPALMSLVAVVGLITIVGSVYSILYNERLYDWLSPRGWLQVFGGKTDPQLEKSELESGPSYSDHIIVVGMNPLGRMLAERLHQVSETVLAIDTDPGKLTGLPCRTMIGNVDYPEVLKEAGLERAKLAVTALQIEDANLLFAFRCRQVGVPVAVHVFDPSVLDNLQRQQPRFLIDSKSAADDQLRRALNQAGVLEL